MTLLNNKLYYHKKVRILVLMLYVLLSNTRFFSDDHAEDYSIDQDEADREGDYGYKGDEGYY
jgi:hypothetical protein